MRLIVPEGRVENSPGWSEAESWEGAFIESIRPVGAKRTSIRRFDGVHAIALVNTGFDNGELSRVLSNQQTVSMRTPPSPKGPSMFLRFSQNEDRPMKCDWCESTDMRTSRFRQQDLPRLFLFQYPVRCHACHQRTFANFFSALKLPNSASSHPIASELREAHGAPQALKVQRTVRCGWCGSANLRTSRFQLTDLRRLLLLHYPVRCRSCRERSYRFLFLLWRLPKAARVHRIEKEIGDAPRDM
jgi:hypothetical protein